MKNLKFTLLPIVLGQVCILLILSLFLSQNLTAQTYCAARGTAPWEQWLERVSIANASGSRVFPITQKEGYGNFTAQPAAIMLRGQANLVTISPTASWLGDPRNANLFWRVWIDLNQDNDFIDAGEQIISSPVNYASQLFLDNERAFTLPTISNLGLTRLRVALKMGGFPEPCETFERGEVEDYTVQITEGGVAQPDLTFSNIVAPTTARLNEFLNFSCRFRNIGTAAARSPFGTYGYIMLIKENTTPVYLRYLTGPFDMRAGLDSLVTFNEILPFYIASGNYTLRFVADLENRIVESNETNNVFDFPISILPATTDNSGLKVLSVTGQTLANPSTNLPLSITIKNEGTLSSAPDSVFYATWRRQFFNGGYAPSNYALNRVAVPAIAAGATVTVNANFSLPATLRTTVVNNFLNIEPYVMLLSKTQRLLIRAPIFPDSFARHAYFYPIQPLAQTDLALTGSQLTTTWDSTSASVELSLTIQNNGTATAQNINVNVHNSSVTNSITTFNGSEIDSITLLSGAGQVSRIFTDVNAGREENGRMFHLWKIPQLAAGASTTAIFRGKVVGFRGVPQPVSFYYNDKTMRPYILYADVRDANRANDSIAPFTFRYERTINTNLPDLTLQNLTVPTPSVNRGQILNWQVDIRNIGTAAASGLFKIKAYISTDNILSADDIQDGIIPTGNYAAGLTQTQVGGASTIPTSLAVGNYYLILKIDADDQITEGVETNNILVSSNTFTVTGTPVSTCLNRFDLEGFTPTACVRNSFASGALGYGRLNQLGQNLSDGISLSIGILGNNGHLFARNGTTTQPTGSKFRNCAANWLYFNAEGGIVKNDARSTNIEFPSVIVRVRSFGNAANPDSIYVEIDSNAVDLPKHLVSIAKSQNCNTCFISDRTPPVFQNCPTTEVVFPLAFSSDQVSASTILRNFNITSSDNCTTADNNIQFNFPNLLFATWRSVYDLKIVRFDLAGNKATCAFKVRMSNPPCSTVGITRPTISNCPQNISVQAASGATCAVATWTAPTATGLADISVSLTSNFASGFCFPIGSTTVSYVAVDSCGSRDTCRFTVTVTGGTTTQYCASKGVAPWEYAISNVTLNTINNTSDKFKDFNTLGYSDYTNLTTTLNKGQNYPLSITPLLSWIGNVPNVFCRVWIDFNQNKTFEASELVLEKTNANPLTANVLISNAATIGTTRMRVAVKWGSYPTACEIFDKGEVEDYTINIESGSGSCTNDVTPPVFVNCPSDTTVTIGQNLPYYELSWTNPTATDNCSTPSVSSNFGTPYIRLSDGQTATVIFTARDAAGNTAACTWRVTASRQVSCPPQYAAVLAAFQEGTTTRYQTATGDCANVVWDSATAANRFTVYQRSNNPLDGFDLVGRIDNFGGTSLYTLFLRNGTTTRPTNFPDLACSSGTGRIYFQNITGSFIQSGRGGSAGRALEITNSNAVIIQGAVGQTNSLLAAFSDINNGFGILATTSTPNCRNCTADMTPPTFVCPRDTTIILPTTVPSFCVFPSAPQATDNCSPYVATFTNDIFMPICILPNTRRVFRSGAFDPNGNRTICNYTITVQNQVSGGADLALSLAATPSVYQQYSIQNFRISAKNVGNQAFTNVKIKFTRPNFTVNGGNKVASVGTFQDFCPGGIECSEWTIPTLAGGATATLDVPVYVLNATAAIMASTQLVVSTPVDNNGTNNSATAIVNPAPAQMPINALTYQVPTQLIPVIIQHIGPNPSDGAVLIKLDSWTKQMVVFNFSDITGKTMYSEKRALEKGLNRIEFDLTALPQGVYFIQTNVGKGKNVPTKLIKM